METLLEDECIFLESSCRIMACSRRSLCTVEEISLEFKRFKLWSEKTCIQRLSADSFRQYSSKIIQAHIPNDNLADKSVVYRKSI